MFWIVPFLMAASMAAQQAGNSGCTSCHDQGQKLASSAHAEVACDTCHERHENYPHPSGVEKPTCAACHAEVAGEHARGVHGQAIKHGNTAAPNCSVCHGSAHELARPSSTNFRKNVPEICGMCHSDIAAQFEASVHGKALARGLPDAPLCTDCHGEHSILAPKNPASPVASLHIRETCASCHGDVRLARKFGLPPDRITTFDASFHGLAARGGSQTVANCASCHSFHNILPSSDPKSTVHPSNLAKTCGHCHPGAGTRFALGKVHWVEGAGEPTQVRWVRYIYLFIIPATLAFMLLHHGGNWTRKLYRLRFRPAAQVSLVPAPPELRMFASERVVHGFLVISFAVLVWTGFALKYPDSFWARPMLHWEKSWPVRGTIHRIAAVVMTAAGLAHLLSLIVSRRLRSHWRHMLPRASDAVQAAQGLLYNVGLRSAPPVLPSHTYVEKIEYWAVLWGTAVMGMTGFMLWANKFMLAWMPKDWLDAATAVHFYEAVLATFSILIWHFYTVIFDPDVYPMDPAWLTGITVRRRMVMSAAKPASQVQEVQRGIPKNDSTKLTAG